jgi:hypothetical protein
VRLRRRDRRADRTGDETRRQLNGALLTKDETRILERAADEG